MDTTLDSPPWSECQQNESDIDETNSFSCLSIDTKPKESLVTSVHALNSLVDKKVRDYEEKIALLERQSDEFQIKMQEAKMQFEAKLAETKIKKWCHNCWNEVTFKNFMDPPACSIECYDKLLGSDSSPAFSISSDSSDGSVTSEINGLENDSPVVNEPNENGAPKSSLHQNGNGLRIDGNDDFMDLTSDDDTRTEEDKLAMLIQDLEN